MVKKILMLLLPLLGFVGGAVGGDLLHAPKSDEKSVAADGEAAARIRALTAELRQRLNCSRPRRGWRACTAGRHPGLCA